MPALPALTDRPASVAPAAAMWLAAACLALTAGCAPHEHAEKTPPEGEAWAVTAWGGIYEIFPEIDPLIAGQSSESHTHVTVLADFSALTAGEVAIVLRDAAGVEQVFSSAQAKRPGIFPIELRPGRPGEFALLFRVDSPAGREEIPGGRVRVGDAANPGGLLAPAAPVERAQSAAEAAGGEEISFLKEQQWKTPFATAWTQAGELAGTRVAPARVTARPGGDRLITAPVDGIVRASPFPHPGLIARSGVPLFALTPQLDPERSLAEIEGEQHSALAELALAKAEARRARDLARDGLISIADRERAEAALDVANARAEAARRDAATARRARGGGESAGESIPIRAPFHGSLAAVRVSAGQAVKAGDELGRFVAAGAPWLEAWLAPEAVAGLAVGPTRVSLRAGGDSAAPEWSNLRARLVAIAPALDADSGRRTILLELAAPPPGLAVGQSVDVELEAGAPQQGIVLPETAIVDDAGVAVVYVQSGGETMRRREVRVLGRAGGRCLVGGLSAGERVVTVGGTAIRRSTLISAGAGEGHVH